MTDAAARALKIEGRAARRAKKLERREARRTKRDERGSGRTGTSAGEAGEAAAPVVASAAAGSRGEARRELAAALALKKDKTVRRGRFKTMLQSVKAVLERYPDYHNALTAQLSLLRRMERFPKAAKLVEKYRERFPKDRKLMLMHAAILDDMKDYAGALALIVELRSAETPTAAIEEAYIKALVRVDRADDAEAACVTALSAFPGDVRLLRQYAGMATRRGDWDEALRRWQDAVARWPDNAGIKRGLDDARLHVADREPPGAESHTGESGKFFARFESLGGNMGGCEFGMVQRKFGSSSLSLLIWSNVPIEAITEGLHNGFQGLGEVANTELRTFKPTPDREEYRIWDLKYGLGAHTFIQTKDAPADKMLLQTTKRLTYLRGKLLEELGTAKKVFVYKIRDAVDDGVLRAIFTALRRQGPAALLCVLKAEGGNVAGSVRKIEDGLFVGYVGYFMREAPGAEAESIDYTTWQKICTETLAQHEAAA